MDAIFKKKDIKSGYLLRVRDRFGDEHNLTVAVNADGDLGCCNPGVHWCPLENFTDNLDMPKGRDRLCIIAVYGGASNARLLDNDIFGRALLWEREPKKMTVGEISEALGFPVEIVEG